MRCYRFRGRRFGWDDPIRHELLILTLLNTAALISRHLMISRSFNDILINTLALCQASPVTQLSSSKSLIRTAYKIVPKPFTPTQAIFIPDL
jgi:hypothetical protein